MCVVGTLLGRTFDREDTCGSVIWVEQSHQLSRSQCLHGRKALAFAVSAVALTRASRAALPTIYQYET